MQSRVQPISGLFLNGQSVSLAIKREDQLHPLISGNKYRKLKYNLLEAKKQQHHTLLTFGGAYSNHILATAAASHAHRLHSIGVIRGDELKNSWANNPTLAKAASFGMRFHFISRNDYRLKETPEFLEAIKKRFGQTYLLPEGGTNALAIKGCEEILSVADIKYDYICCPVGTGGTLAGLINGSKPYQKVMGFMALNDPSVANTLNNFAKTDNWRLVGDYDFGGYAKIDAQLVDFINAFKTKHQVLLDPIYTAKMVFGIFDLAKNGYFRPNSKILAIHTGGLQAIEGMNAVLKTKKLPLVNIW